MVSLNDDIRKILVLSIGEERGESQGAHNMSNNEGCVLVTKKPTSEVITRQTSPFLEHHICRSMNMALPCMFMSLTEKVRWQVFRCPLQFFLLITAQRASSSSCPLSYSHKLELLGKLALRLPFELIPTRKGHTSD